MRSVIFALILLMLMACSKTDASKSISHIAESSPENTPEKIAETDTLPPLSPVLPNIKLTTKQRKYLNDSLPKEAQEILEKAEGFEILAEVNAGETSETDLRKFTPNRVAQITDNRLKRKILEAFYSDAAREDGPANCYEPHHGIRATYQGKTLEIDICFDCAQFVGGNVPDDFFGTIVRDGRKSESLFTGIIEEKGIELK